jgi:superfamily II DNA or RNA helicase
MNRDERQVLGLQRWSKSSFQGIAEYPTGFGKTYTAIRAIIGMISRKGIKKAMVVVPTITLKEQWEKELAKKKVKIAEVYVINSAIKEIHDVDLLILDEVHRYAAETFKEIFVQTTYKYILGLTATLEREDGLHDIILQYMDVFDRISIEEALENGWISPYKIFNVAVPFNQEDLVAYTKADKGFKYYAMLMGRGMTAFKTAQQWIKSNDSAEKGKAAAYFNSMRARKRICLNNVNKVHATKTIIEALPERNGLTFSADTKFADLIQDALGDISMTFHSKIGKKDQEHVMKRFKDKRTKIRILNTCKALNEGLDVPECSLGVVAGSNSTKLTFIQQLGRTVRKVPGKEAYFVNLYTPNTQEEVWLKKRLKGVKEEFVTNCTLDEFIALIKAEENDKRAA